MAGREMDVASAAPGASEGAESAGRSPQQERGQRRVQAILDAAEQLIAERGVEAVSTNQIAAHAGSSVGSLYHFFPNRDAIVRALADRFLAGLRAVNFAALTDEAAQLPVPELMDRVIDPMVAFHLAHPAYRHVYEATRAAAAAHEAELHEAITARVEAMLARRVPTVAPDVRRLRARASVQLVHGFMDYVQCSRTAPPEEAVAIIGELKRLMVLYFEDLDRLAAAS